MKTLICQTNTTPGAFNTNTMQIVNGIKQAEEDKCDLVVFPELSIPGYLCKDMMFRKGFVNDNLECLQIVVKATFGENGRRGNLHAIVGYIDENHEGVGKPFRNMAAVIKNGLIIATYQKHLLPFYDVFDEGRYFQPGTQLTVVEICGEKWGICICEDLWNDKGSDDYNYADNPLQGYRSRKVNNIISINSSPYVKGKPQRRVDIVRKSFDSGTVVYCNQIGGQDELVFDGNSFVIKNGYQVAYSKDELYSSFDDHPLGRRMWRCDEETPKDNLYQMLKLGLGDYINKSGFKKVVVGSSGGIDSALTIALASDVLGAKNVMGVRMPSVISSDHSKNDALELHKNLGCEDYIVPIEHNPFITHILDSLGCNRPLYTENNIANENIQARLRGLILMYISNSFNALLLTTGNKTELALGYCTIFGDMMGGFAPIADLYKMEVYGMAKYFNENVKNAIPENIIRKAPSAELAPGQTDEASLLPYPILDSIVKAYVEDYIADFDTWNTTKTATCTKDKYNEMIRRINNNEFKRRQAAPGIKVSKVAFGIGRRLPIVKG